MTATPVAAFDQHIERWRQEQTFPWHKLKYQQADTNLAKHLPKQPLRILDAGGGNGFESVPLAQQGHQIDLIDYSTAMLADAQKRIAANGVVAQVHCHQADVNEMAHLFPVETFDVVLCHNVLQYVQDVPTLLNALRAPLKKTGWLSLIGVNRFSRVYTAAFLRDDLVEALAQIDVRTVHGVVFDTPLTNYSAQEIITMLTAAGYDVEQDYGLLCVTSYWGDTQRKYDPIIYTQLEQLEQALTDQHPYKLVASYYQIIARKRA